MLLCSNLSSQTIQWQVCKVLHHLIWNIEQHHTRTYPSANQVRANMMPSSTILQWDHLIFLKRDYLIEIYETKRIKTHLTQQTALSPQESIEETFVALPPRQIIISEVRKTKVCTAFQVWFQPSSVELQKDFLVHQHPLSTDHLVFALACHSSILTFCDSCMKAPYISQI